LENLPKRITIETGYSRLLKSNIDEISNSGFAFGFYFMCPVSGFSGKPKAFISLPLGYSVIPPKDTSKDFGIAYYGIHITHELSNKSKNIPFVGYSLLFNQLRKQYTEGRVIDHETHFDAGYYFGEKVFLKAEDSIASYPELENPISDKLSNAGLKIG
jgi:hypothetical protein